MVGEGEDEAELDTVVEREAEVLDEVEEDDEGGAVFVAVGDNEATFEEEPDGDKVFVAVGVMEIEAEELSEDEEVFEGEGGGDKVFVAVGDTVTSIEETDGDEVFVGEIEIEGEEEVVCVGEALGDVVRLLRVKASREHTNNINTKRIERSWLLFILFYNRIGTAREFCKITKRKFHKENAKTMLVFFIIFLGLVRNATTGAYCDFLDLLFCLGEVATLPFFFIIFCFTILSSVLSSFILLLSFFLFLLVLLS